MTVAYKSCYFLFDLCHQDNMKSGIDHEGGGLDHEGGGACTILKTLQMRSREDYLFEQTTITCIP